MDISNEANIDLFPIGPNSIIGRTIAFRVLLCKSMAHLRRQMVAVLLRFMYRVRDRVVPIFSWFHPRNPRGILALVAFIAFILQRYAIFQTRKESANRRKFWRNTMRTALTYEEWAHAARMLDRENSEMNESEFYDEELVRNKLQELRRRRQEGSLRDIIFCMRADLIRNLGNMCNPELHKDSLQVPRLIKDYIDEVTTQLRMVCESDSEELFLEEKLAFMHETRHAFGRTALLLSGGASLGAFHVGVVKTLVEHKLLPRVIAGSSVGSIMCAIVATRSWPELQSFFHDSYHSLNFFGQMGGIFTVFKRVMTFGAVHEIRQLQMMLRKLTSNLTFQEAYDMTGRILAITVCSPRKHEPPRCLNYLTSPHVVIWSAVTASCAFPGLFEAQELMAKDRSGNIVPCHPPFHLGPEEGGMPARRWRDGSLESDLPMMQLKELFNVNHFIVSQANPRIASLLRLKAFVRAYGGNVAAKLAELTEMEVKHRCNQILALGFPLGGIAKLFGQEWEGHVTVVMPATLAQCTKIIQNPSNVEIQKAANQGSRCTWEKLSAMKANCAIEFALDECVAILNHMRRLKRSAERAAAAAAAASYSSPSGTGRFNASKRIPSWNCIARENSHGSLDDLASKASSLQQGASMSSGVPSGWNHRTGRGIPDGSESESDSVDHNTWTRSGGPLMRTTSAAKFIEFLQSLDIESEMNRSSLDDLASEALQQGARTSSGVPSGRNHRDEGMVPTNKSRICLEELLKGCCSILFLLSEDYDFEKDTLIQLWMAAGIINNEPMELVGEMCVDNLLSKGCIFSSGTNFVTGKDTYRLNMKINDELDWQTDDIGRFYLKWGNAKHNNMSTEIQHISLVCDDIDETIFQTLQQFNCLKTLLFQRNYGHKIRQLPDLLLMSLQELRTLDLSRTHIRNLPGSVMHMIHLRYLDLSWTLIEWLPEIVCTLSELQTLKLRGCSNLHGLPEQLHKLKKLRHLDVDVLLQLAGMPRGMGALVNLRTLSAFLIGSEDGCKIKELQELNNLTGKFCIALLEHVSNAYEAREAALSEKKHIRKLELRWTASQSLKTENKISFEVLECLEPSSALEELEILCYGGSTFPNWISDPKFDKLVSVTFFKCEHISELPLVNQLPSLRYLCLVEMHGVKKIDRQGTKNRVAFPELEKLEITEMHSLEILSWTEANEGDFKCLVELIICDCPKLQKIHILPYLSSLRQLELRECPELESLSDKALPLSLQDLTVEDCPQIEKKCSKDVGEDWHKIQHIPNVQFCKEDEENDEDDESYADTESSEENLMLKWKQRVRDQDTEKKKDTESSEERSDKT